MAEFQEVIHQTKRICKSVNGNCGKCLLGAFSCPNNARFDSTDEQKFIEFANAVMTWAAEHPVVYPTWWEWLFSIGAVTRKVKPDVAAMLIDTGLLDPIPADIAQKLGIEPKK